MLFVVVHVLAYILSFEKVINSDFVTLSFSTSGLSRVSSIFVFGMEPICLLERTTLYPSLPNALTELSSNATASLWSLEGMNVIS